MPNTPPSHCAWFHDTEATLLTSDGEKVGLIEFRHEEVVETINQWALHLRRQYSSDEELSALSSAHDLSRGDFLREMIFPGDAFPGPTIRAGDFGEILVADFVEYSLNFTVPRTRYDRKTSPNASTGGVDVLGYKISPDGHTSQDELVTFEVKASLASGSNSLQNAIDGSKKDFSTKTPISLIATWLRLKDQRQMSSMQAVERFMNREARPYRYISGAALVCSSAFWNNRLVENLISAHPNDDLFYLVFSGDDLMVLANRLYETACVTA